MALRIDPICVNTVFISTILENSPRLENFTEYRGFPDTSHCLQNSGSQKRPRLEEKKKKTELERQRVEKKERGEGRKARTHANKSEYSFPRLLRLDQFSGD